MEDEKVVAGGKVVDRKVVDRKIVGVGPGGEAVIYFITTKDNQTFEHFIGCPGLKKVYIILGQEKEKIEPKRLRNDISLFIEILSGGNVLEGT